MDLFSIIHHQILHHFVNVSGRPSVETVLPAGVSVEESNYAWANEGLPGGGQSALPRPSKYKTAVTATTLKMQPDSTSKPPTHKPTHKHSHPP